MGDPLADELSKLSVELAKLKLEVSGGGHLDRTDGVTIPGTNTKRSKLNFTRQCQGIVNEIVKNIETREKFTERELDKFYNITSMVSSQASKNYWEGKKNAFILREGRGIKKLIQDVLGFKKEFDKYERDGRINPIHYPDFITQFTPSSYY